MTFDPSIGVGNSYPTVSPVNTGLIRANRTGLVYSTVGAVATGANTTATVLASTVLPAGSLAQVGDKVIIRAWGSFGATGNNKTVALAFGSASITTGAVASNAGIWSMTLTVLKSGASTQKVLGQGSYGTTSVTPTITSATETDGTGILCKLTGTNGTAAASDIVLNGFYVEFAG